MKLRIRFQIFDKPSPAQPRQSINRPFCKIRPIVENVASMGIALVLNHVFAKPGVVAHVQTRFVQGAGKNAFGFTFLGFGID